MQYNYILHGGPPPVWAWGKVNCPWALFCETTCHYSDKQVDITSSPKVYIVTFPFKTDYSWLISPNTVLSWTLVLTSLVRGLLVLSVLIGWVFTEWILLLLLYELWRHVPTVELHECMHTCTGMNTLVCLHDIRLLISECKEFFWCGLRCMLLGNNKRLL